MICSQFATRLTIYGVRNMDNRRSRKHKATKFKPSAANLRHAYKFFKDCGEESRAQAAKDALWEDYRERIGDDA